MVHPMPRVRSLSSSSESADAQIDAAVLRLVVLLARQVARELAADALDVEETPHASTALQKD